MAKPGKSKVHSSPRLSKKSFPRYSPNLLIAVIVIALLGFLLIRSSFRPQFYEPVGINEVGNTTTGKINLTLTPATTGAKVGDELLLTLSINPEDNYKVGSATIELSYDSSLVGTPTLTQGSYFQDKIGTPTVGNGKISFVYTTSTSQGLVSGNGTVATIKLYPQKAGTATLSFTEATTLVGTPSDNDPIVPYNLLKSANNAVITITSDASPSPAESGSPSPSPSPSPSSGNTTEKPNKPTGLRSNCYDNGSKITLRWDSVSGATSYKLRLSKKSGNDYQSIDGLTSTEHNLALSPNQEYSWWVHTTRSGVDSEEAKIETVKCESSSTPTPTPSSTPTATPKASTKATSTPKPSSKTSPSPSASNKTITPSGSVAPSLFPISSPGSLSDIFTTNDSTNNSDSSKAITKPGLLKMIVLGWRAILEKVANVFK